MWKLSRALVNSHLEEITSIHVTDELLMPQDLKKIAQLRHSRKITVIWLMDDDERCWWLGGC